MNLEPLTVARSALCFVESSAAIPRSARLHLEYMRGVVEAAIGLDFGDVVRAHPHEVVQLCAVRGIADAGLALASKIAAEYPDGAPS